MRAMERAETRDLQMHVLDEFAAVCEREHIRWYLCAGTLLGAIRYRGFIPWDDDVDVMVPRADYDRLCRVLANEAPKGTVHSSLSAGDYPFPFSKLHDTRTWVHEALDPMPDVGVGIDIFPLDYWPQGRLRRGLERRTAQALGAYLVLATLDTPPASLPRATVRLALRMLRRFVRLRAIARLLDFVARSSPQKTGFCGVRCWGYFEVEPSAAYEEVISVEFEGRHLPAPRGFDQVLTAIFGDYLTPPPPGDQRPPHARREYWREVS